MNGPIPGGCWWNAVETWRKLRESGVANARYVEGWGVRDRDGRLEPFEHGWAEREPGGAVVDESPNHGCLEYFPAIRSDNPDREQAERGIPIPFYRQLTCPHVDGYPNPKYDAEAALRYAQAKLAADAYCREHNS